MTEAKEKEGPTGDRLQGSCENDTWAVGGTKRLESSLSVVGHCDFD